MKFIYYTFVRKDFYLFILLQFIINQLKIYLHSEVTLQIYIHIFYVPLLYSHHIASV